MLAVYYRKKDMSLHNVSIVWERVQMLNHHRMQCEDRISRKPEPYI